MLLDENLKKLENNVNPLNTTNLNKSKHDLDTSHDNIVDKNIKKDKVKDIKKNREALEAKVTNIELQLKKLIEGESDFNTGKKIQVKLFLENIERDKSFDNDKYKKWDLEREERINHFTEMQRRNEERAKDELIKQTAKSLSLVSKSVNQLMESKKLVNLP